MERNVDYIVSSYGLENQLEQAVEEASEFILAAQKFKRNRRSVEICSSNESRMKLIEETADLIVMMEQMRIYLGRSAVDKQIEYKIERQIGRIKSRYNESDESI